MQIQPFGTNYLGAVVGLSLRAWSPVFDSIKSVMDADTIENFTPTAGARANKRRSKKRARAEDMRVWTATENAETIGNGELGIVSTVFGQPFAATFLKLKANEFARFAK